MLFVTLYLKIILCQVLRSFDKYYLWEDTSLHDIDLAINKISEEANEDINIIWGLRKILFNGKFKISVISTGIDS